MIAGETPTNAADLLRRLTEPAPAPEDLAIRRGCIDVEHLGGVRYGFSYAHLVWVELHPNGGLVLDFSSHAVSVTGRNLRLLYEQILERRVQRLEGKGNRYDTGVPDELFVERVVVTPKGQGPGEILAGLVPNFGAQGSKTTPPEDGGDNPNGHDGAPPRPRAPDPP